MDLSEYVSVCWPVDLLWPPAACRTLGDLAPDGGLARHHYWLSHSVRQVIPLHGVCVRADVLYGYIRLWQLEGAQSTKWVRHLGPK